MLRYLRGVRKRLIAENKYTQYFQYAFGEIFLVVVGILIALAISNWNENKEKEKRAERFLERLTVQLEKNLETLDFHIEVNELYYSYAEQLITIIGEEQAEYNDAKIDSLVMFNLYDFNLNLDMNILIEGRENGDLALVESEELTQSLYGIIKSYDEILERERITNTDLNDRFLPYLNKHYNFSNLLARMYEEPEATSKIYKGDNYKMLFDQQFENLIVQRQNLGVDLLDTYTWLREELQEIHQSIKN